MFSLREAQRWFAAALFDGDTAALAALVCDDGIDPLARLGIYRNQLEENFRRALAIDFPVMRRLVGEDYFRQLALELLAAAPSRSGDLHELGAQFPEFLRGRFAAAEFGYFGDVAALEWAHSELLIAADPPALALESLASIPAERLAQLRFAALPSGRLLRSAYPIVRIWLANRSPGDDATIDLAAGGDRVLLCRGPEGIEFHRLDAASFAFAAALTAGVALGAAFDAALEAGGTLDLGAELRRLVGRGVLAAPRLDAAPTR